MHKIYRYKLSLFNDGEIDIIANSPEEAELKLARQLDALVETESLKVIGRFTNE